MHPTPIVCLALCLGFAPGQDEPGQEAQAGLGQKDPAGAARAAARTALEDGRLADANRHLQRVLLHTPGDADLLLEVLDTLEDDPDSRQLWTLDWFELSADGAGRASPGGAARRRLSDNSWASRLTNARAEAVAELGRFASDSDKEASKKPAQRLLGDWARRLALDLARPVSRLDQAARAEHSPLFGVAARAHAPVASSLERQMKSSLSRGDAAMAMRAARSLHGLAVQGDFKDLKGPRPGGMGSLRARAAAGLARARRHQKDAADEPWSIADLEWLTTEEGEAFTRRHDSFAEPGLGLSPQAWYRVETDCGFETLLGVASTIELHHQRLVNWYGQDPFVGRQGTVRIVPEPNGLEAEGAPFWWVGGFQGGDTTVMRFAQGNIEGLGHGLTHELTHRFDGAIYPGQPAWLTEGKAVWTASAYGPSKDEGFVAMHASFGTLQGVLIDGWGRPGKLETLITGELEDYRANYSAGYSLYVFLNTWEEGGRRLYQDRLQRFMQSGKGRKDSALEYFERHFCDGKDGRPEGFVEFGEAFGRFLRGFYWKDRAEWTSRYSQRVPPTSSQPYVYDEPTWTWQRNRSEPYFGQDQARVAARLLLDAGKEKDAVRALVWALGVDGREPRCLRWLAETLMELKQRDCAWVARHALVFPTWPSDEPAPFLKKLPKVRALLALQEQAAREQAAQGAATASAALAADHDRLALWTGAPLLRMPARDLQGLRHPFDRAPWLLSDRGWVEDELTGYDKKRTVGLWYGLIGGDLLVGRRDPRKGTGKVDRGGGGMAFTRSEDYLLPGTYRIDTRVRFTTAFGRGQVVLGYQRRDQSLRFTFSGGDYMYAIGESEEPPAFEEVSWSLSGMWERDGALGGSTRSGKIDFGRERTAFDLSFIVDGASVQALVDGRLVGTYHTADGRPIEGYVGFASSHGAFQFSAPRAQRLERSRLSGRVDLLPAGLHLDRQRTAPFADLENRPVYGLAPSSNGSLLLWIPTPWSAQDEPVDVEEVRRKALFSAGRLAEALQRSGATQPVVVALPARMGAEPLRQLDADVHELFDDNVRVLAHPYSGQATPGLGDAADLGKRWILFIDAAGVARVVAPLISVEGGFDGRLAHWLTVFKDHGRPQRDLPQPLRMSEDPEQDDVPVEDDR